MGVKRLILNRFIPMQLYHRYTKKSIDHNSRVLLIYGGILQHVSVRRDHLQVIYTHTHTHIHTYIYRITKNRHGGKVVYIYTRSHFSN